MTTDIARPRTKATIGDALLDVLPGTPRKLKELRHGWRVLRGARQIAAGYVSDNAAWRAVEFALNQDLLAELPAERIALISWLKHQKQRFGGRESKIHQLGDPVDWFRIGFASASGAHTFLGEFDVMRKRPDVSARWDIPQSEGGAVAIAPPGSRLAQADAAGARVYTVSVAPANCGLPGGGERDKGISQEALAYLCRIDRSPGTY